MAISPISFLQQVRAEMRKVVWPTRAQTIRLTMIVIGISAVVSLFISALDVIFVKITELVIR